MNLFHGYCNNDNNNDDKLCIWNGKIHYSINNNNNDIMLNDHISAPATTATSSNKNIAQEDGNLFEIQSFHNLKLKSIDTYLNLTNDEIPVQIEYMIGSYYEKSLHAKDQSDLKWNIMFQGNVKGNGYYNSTSVLTTVYNDVELFNDNDNNNNTVTIMINLKEKLLLTSFDNDNAHNNNDIISLNDDMQVRKGYSVDRVYNPVKDNMIFMGNIHYISDLSLISNTPSLTPSILPSYSPSVIPSISPTILPSLVPTTISSNASTNMTSFPPSILPTQSPTQPLPEDYVDIYYSFSILCPLSQESTILNIMDTSIQSSLNTLLYEEDEDEDSASNNNNDPLKNIIKINNIAIHSIKSILNHDETIETNCIHNQDNLCFILYVNTTIGYDANNPNITESILQYLFLSLSSKITIMLPFSYQEYIGDVPLFTSPIISLLDDDDDLETTKRKLNEMDEYANEYYENTMKDFLSNIATTTSQLEITEVSTSYNMDILSAIISSLSSQEQQNNIRCLQESRSNSGFNLSTGIMGKYRPPPEVIFDKLVQDSIDTYGDVLVSKLKEYPTFSNIKSVKAEFNTSSSDRNNITIGSMSAKEDSIEEPKGGGGVGSTTILIIISAIIGLWIFIVAVVCAIKRTKKRNFYEDNHNNIMDLPIPVSIGVDDDDRRNSRYDKRPSHIAQNTSGGARVTPFFGGIDHDYDDDCNDDYYHNNNVNNYHPAQQQPQNQQQQQNHPMRYNHLSQHNPHPYQERRGSMG